MLKGSGLLNRTPGTRFDDDTASAIGQGQQRLNRDHGTAVGRKPLKIDSLINPDGPTQTATRGLARQVADQWRGFEQRRNPALPTANLPNPQRPSVTPVVENAFTADIKRLQDTLTADQTGELTRLADGLSKTRTPGAVASDISEAINSDGLKAVAEFQVVRDRLAKVGTPDQVQALDEAVLGGVSEEAKIKLRNTIQNRNVESQELPGGISNVDPKNTEDTPSQDNLRDQLNPAGTDSSRKAATEEISNALEDPEKAKALRDAALEDLATEKLGAGEYLKRSQQIREAFPETRNRDGEVEVAFVPVLAVPIVMGGIATAGVIGNYVNNNRKKLGLEKLFGPQNRMDVAKPLPPVPGSEPTDIDFGQERFPDLSDEDHAPQVPNFDPPETDTQTPPFPDQGDEFNKPQILHIDLGDGIKTDVEVPTNAPHKAKKLEDTIRLIKDKSVKQATADLVKGGVVTGATRKPGQNEVTRKGGKIAADRAFEKAVRQCGGDPAKIEPDEEGTKSFPCNDGTTFVRYNLSRSGGKETVVAQIKGRRLDKFEDYGSDPFVKVRFPE